MVLNFLPVDAAEVWVVLDLVKLLANAQSLLVVNIEQLVDKILQAGINALGELKLPVEHILENLQVLFASKR